MLDRLVYWDKYDKTVKLYNLHLTLVRTLVHPRRYLFLFSNPKWGLKWSLWGLKNVLFLSKKLSLQKKGCFLRLQFWEKRYLKRYRFGGKRYRSGRFWLQKCPFFGQKATFYQCKNKYSSKYPFYMRFSSFFQKRYCLNPIIMY